MNNLRRKQIANLVERLEGLKEELNDIYSDEEEYHENVPENLQETDRYYASTAAMDLLEEAECDLADALSKLEEIE